jgi:hypothetical protein
LSIIADIVALTAFPTAPTVRRMLLDAKSRDKREPSAPGLAPKRETARKRCARPEFERPPSPPGWHTSDDDEVALRCWRGRTDIVAVAALEPEQDLFGNPWRADRR